MPELPKDTPSQVACPGDRNLFLGLSLSLFLLVLPPLPLRAAEISQSSLRSSLKNEAVEILRIKAETGDYLQYGEEAFWFTQNSFWGKAKTFRIDPTTYAVTRYKRPYQPGPADLLIAERAAWFSQCPPSGFHGSKGKADLWRFSLESERIEATFAKAGSPFDFAEGILWAFNPHEQTITGIDVATNQISTQWAIGAARKRNWGSRNLPLNFGESFAYAQGSVWMCRAVGSGDRGWTGNLDGLQPTFVQRFDPQSHKRLATLSLGNIHSLSRLSHAFDDLWIIGHRDLSSSTPSLLRIDTATNTLSHEIPLQWGAYERGSSPTQHRAIVPCNDFLWVILPYQSRSIYHRTSLLKIDPTAHQVVDRLDIEGAYSDRILVAKGHLWIGFADELWRIAPW